MDTELIGSALGIIGALVLIAPDLRYKAIACTLWLVSNLFLIVETLGKDQPYMASMFILYAALNAFTIAVTLATLKRIYTSSGRDPSG